MSTFWLSMIQASMAEQIIASLQDSKYGYSHQVQLWRSKCDKPHQHKITKYQPPS